MKYTDYIQTDQYYLRGLKKTQDFGPFNVDQKPVDINVAVVFEKQGNGLGDASQMLDDTQDNIRERFGLNSAADYAADDSDDY